MEVDIIEKHYEKKQRNQRVRQWIGGVLFTFFLAFLGYLLANAPGFHLIGQMALAILIAVAYRNVFGYPETLKSGIAFSSKQLLRAAIILYGLKLNITVVLQDGLSLLIRDALIIAFAIAATLWLAKIMKAERKFSLLLGVGTGVCGAAAIAAVAPIIKAKDEDTALSVGMIAFIGTIFAVVYAFLARILPLSMNEYAIWAGMSLHELAHVVLAAAPAGDGGLALALLAKLGRVLLLVPLCFMILFFMKRKNAQSLEKTTKVQIPYFLFGFVAFSLLGSFVIGPVIPVNDSVMHFISETTAWLLTAAMVGLGLNINLRDLRSKVLRPLLVLSLASVLVSLFAFALLLTV